MTVQKPFWSLAGIFFPACVMSVTLVTPTPARPQPELTRWALLGPVQGEV
jgi:hypothetical protein